MAEPGRPRKFLGAKIVTYEVNPEEAERCLPDRYPCEERAERAIARVQPGFDYRPEDCNPSLLRLECADLARDVLALAEALIEIARKDTQYSTDLKHLVPFAKIGRRALEGTDGE